MGAGAFVSGGYDIFLDGYTVLDDKFPSIVELFTLSNEFTTESEFGVYLTYFW